MVWCAADVRLGRRKRPSNEYLPCVDRPPWTDKPTCAQRSLQRSAGVAKVSCWRSVSKNAHLESVEVCVWSVTRRDSVFPNAVKNKQQKWLQTDVRSKQNNECERMEDVQCVPCTTAKTQSHAVRLQVQSGPRSHREKSVRAQREGESRRVETDAHQHFL